MEMEQIVALPKSTIREIEKSLQKFKRSTKILVIKDKDMNDIFDSGFIKADEVIYLVEHIANLLEVKRGV